MNCGENFKWTFVKYWTFQNNDGLFSDETLFTTMLSDKALAVSDKSKSMEDVLMCEAIFWQKNHRCCTFVHFAPLSTVTKGKVRSIHPELDGALAKMYTSGLEGNLYNCI